MRAYKPWVESLANGFSLDDLETARRVAAALRDRLQVLNDKASSGSAVRGLHSHSDRATTAVKGGIAARGGGIGAKQLARKATRK